MRGYGKTGTISILLSLNGVRMLENDLNMVES